MKVQPARSREVSVMVFALAMLLSGVDVEAAGARQGVKPRPGEIVLLRDVSTRPAYRPAPPGLALIADPSPKSELQHVLGTHSRTGLDELADDEYAALDGGLSATANAGQGTTVERVIDSAVGGTIGGTLGRNGLVSGQGLGRAIGGPMGAVGNATRGIGSQITSALSQFPTTQPGGGP